MTYNHDPFEHDHEQREDFWDTVVTYGSLITFGAFIGWIIIMSIFTI